MYHLTSLHLSVSICINVLYFGVFFGLLEFEFGLAAPHLARHSRRLLPYCYPGHYSSVCEDGRLFGVESLADGPELHRPPHCRQQHRLEHAFSYHHLPWQLLLQQE